MCACVLTPAPQELMEGRDLQARLQQRTPAGKRVFGWWGRGRVVALDIARAIHYIHRWASITFKFRR